MVVVQYLLAHNDVMLPFLENDLMDFILAVPEEYKKDYKLYFSALKKAFPYWYTKIPFQSAGGFNPETAWQKRKRKLKEKIKTFLKIKQQNHFFDYDAYILNQNTQQKMEVLFKTPNKFLVRQNDDFISQYKEEHWKSVRYNAVLALRLVTVKIYFDKVAEVIS